MPFFFQPERLPSPHPRLPAWLGLRRLPRLSHSRRPAVRLLWRPLPASANRDSDEQDALFPSVNSRSRAPETGSGARTVRRGPAPAIRRSAIPAIGPSDSPPSGKRPPREGPPFPPRPFSLEPIPRASSLPRKRYFPPEDSRAHAPAQISERTEAPIR